MLVLKEIYLELFYVLLSFNEKSPSIIGSAMSEMAKVAIKNMTKLIKKFMSDQMKEVSDIMNEILNHINNSFEKVKEKTLEYLY